MAWSDWLSAHGFDLIQTLGIMGGFLFASASLRHEERTQRAATALALTTQHRDLWIEIATRPELQRILDPAADLAKQPLTRQEALFANLLIQHLASSHQAITAKLFKEPAGLSADIKGFFALPIPKAVWEQAKAMQEPGFVAFVEKRMS